MLKFNVGDRVVVLPVARSLYEGETGTISNILPEDSRYGHFVTFEDGHTLVFRADEIELAENGIEQAPAPTFYSYDRVKIKDSLMNGEFAGRAGTVETFRDDFASHGVRIDDFPYVVFFHPNKLELIENPEEYQCGLCESAWPDEAGARGCCSSIKDQIKQSSYAPNQPKPEGGETAPKDNVHQPHHYARFTIEPITFINANGLPYNIGNVIKYACRYDAKNGVEDLRKAIRYLEIHIETLERQERVKAGEDPRDVWKVTI